MESSKVLKEVDKTLQKLEEQSKIFTDDEEQSKLLQKVQDLKERSKELNHQNEEQVPLIPHISSLGYENLAFITLQGDPNLTLTKAKLEEFAVEIQQDEEEAEALR